MVFKLFFILLFAVAGCNYQIDPQFKGSIINAVTVDPDAIDNHQLSNSNSFVQNMDIFINDYVVNLCDITDCESFDTLVDYEKLYSQRNEIINLRLDLYKQIKDTRLNELSKSEKTAFLINAYNFLTIETIIANYIDSNGNKLKSISDIGGASSFKAFDDVPYSVDGINVSLNYIEKTLLKNTITNTDGSLDARFHFAVICAAKGCPILLNEAYSSIKLEEQLDFITKKGLSLKRNYEVVGEITKFTKLFDWYASDFKNHKLDDGSVSNSFNVFMNEFLPNSNVTSNIEFVVYDWSLNTL